MKTQARITFGFGIQIAEDGSRIDRGAAGSALHDIKHLALRLFGGFTLYNVEGGWVSPTGAVSVENGRSLVVYMDASAPTDCAMEVKELVDFIKHRLHQEAVFVSLEFIQTAIL